MNSHWRHLLTESTVILILGTLLALALRLSLWRYETLDYSDFFGPWYRFIVANGRFAALDTNFANYTPPYLYLLVLATYLPVEPLLAIKLIPIVGDMVCAVLIYRLVRVEFPQGNRPVWAYLAFLFAPTVFVNSGLWGQVDGLYTLWLVAAVYFLLRGRELPAWIVIGMAFAFKLQALFLAPLFLILLLKRQLAWKNILIPPFVYILAMVPAWLLGRPFRELMSVYLDQSDFYHKLTMNAPTLYQWLPDSRYDILVTTGLILAVAVIFLFVAAAYQHLPHITTTQILYLACLSVLIFPFVLPKMHERYFYAADVFTLILAFHRPRLAWLPVAVILVSFFSYGPFVFGLTIVPLPILALVQLGSIIFLLRDWLSLESPKNDNLAGTGLGSEVELT